MPTPWVWIDGGRARSGVVLLVLCAGVGWTWAQNDAVGSGAPLTRARADVPSSSGEYRGHRWQIDGNGLMRWDVEPYVRFAFTGNGDLAKLRQAGFDQFTLMPAEEWPIAGPGEYARRCTLAYRQTDGGQSIDVGIVEAVP